MCVSVCVCVRVRERERERESVCVCEREGRVRHLEILDKVGFSELDQQRAVHVVVPLTPNPPQ